MGSPGCWSEWQPVSWVRAGELNMGGECRVKHTSFPIIFTPQCPLTHCKWESLKHCHVSYAWTANCGAWILQHLWRLIISEYLFSYSPCHCFHSVPYGLPSCCGLRMVQHSWFCVGFRANSCINCWNFCYISYCTCYYFVHCFMTWRYTLRRV